MSGSLVRELWLRRTSKVPLGCCQSATPYKSIIQFVSCLVSLFLSRRSSSHPRLSRYDRDIDKIRNDRGTDFTTAKLRSVAFSRAVNGKLPSRLCCPSRLLIRPVRDMNLTHKFVEPSSSILLYIVIRYALHICIIFLRILLRLSNFIFYSFALVDMYILPIRLYVCVCVYE